MGTEADEGEATDCSNVGESHSVGDSLGLLEILTSQIQLTALLLLVHL